MPTMNISLQGDFHPWPDLPKRVSEKDPTMHYEKDAVWNIARLKKGMKSGASSIMLRIDFADGHSFVVETSVENLLAMSKAVEGAEQYDGLR